MTNTQLESRHEPLAAVNVLQLRARLLRPAIDRQIVPQGFRILERPVFRVVFDEKVEWVIDRHVRDQIDLDLELAHRFLKHVAGDPVAVGVLLMIDKMPARRDLLRIGDDPGARMRRRTQPNDLRSQKDRPVVFVMSQMVDAGFNRHDWAPSGLGKSRLDAG